MAKKLLSPELGQVLKDIENAREAINEKYQINGFPDTISAPLLSGNLADSIRDIFVLDTSDGTAKPEDVIKDKIFYVNKERLIGNMPELVGNIQLDIDTLFMDLPPGYYPDGIHAEVEDFTQDGTAQPEDVIKGKVFYSRRQRLTGNMPELDGTVELAYNSKENTLPSGYYKDGVTARLKDYAVSYIWNRQGLDAKTQYVNVGEAFTIPDFGVTELNNEEFIGWSHMANDEDPEYRIGDTVPNFQYEPNLIDQSYVSYLYAVWRKLYNYTLTYNLNGGTNGPPVETYGPTPEEAHNFVINSSIIPTKETHYFLGWGDTPDSNIFVSNKTVTYTNPDAIVYAIWELMSFNDIELEFTYGHPKEDYGVLSNGQEEVTMTVKGQKLSYPGLQRNFDCSGFKTVDKDIEIGDTYYKHKFTFNEVGIYPVIVTHEAPSVGTKAVNGIMKVMNKDGTMGGEGKFGGDRGDRFDTNWIPSSIMPGCTIKEYKFDLRIGGSHSNPNNDQMYILAKKSNGTIIRIRDVFNTDGDGTNQNNPVSEEYPNSITCGNITNTYSNKVGNLKNRQWNLFGTLSKVDDARQIRFIAITYEHAGCATDADIDYNMDYDWDYDLYIKDKNGSSGNTPEPENPEPENPVDPVTPSSRETATILLPQVPTDFSKIPDGSCIEYKYGYYELRGKPKLQQAYVRIYNMFLNNGRPINGQYKYTFTLYDGTVQTDMPMFINTENINEHINVTDRDSNSNCKFTFTLPLTEDTTKKNLGIYLFDLDLKEEDFKYVFGLVMEDCPELLYKFQAMYKYNFFGKTGKINGNNEASPTGDLYVIYVCTEYFFEESIRQSMLETCVNTLNNINAIIDDTYGIKFRNQTFDKNNQLYTPTQMVQIGKVIHDYLEVYNVYGREAGHHINQTMYPALSNGIWNPVCASYARAFQYCCWRWGINAITVSGICDGNGDGIVDSDAGHAWSIVSYQNKPVKDIISGEYWQEVDCTWDDQGASCGYDYGTTIVSDLDEDCSELINNTTKTTGWNNLKTCRWAYFNITTNDINSNKPGAGGTSGGAGKRQRATDYKNLMIGTCNTYTYNVPDDVDTEPYLYIGFENI